jgi:hypothetical protein
MSYALTSSEHYLGTLNTGVEVFSSELSFDCRTWLEEQHYEELAEEEGLRKKSRKGNFYVVLHPSYFEELVAKGEARYRDGQVSDFNKSMWTLLVLVLMTALSACGGTRAAHVAHLTPETSVLGQEMYDTSAVYNMQSVYPDYKDVDMVGFFNSQSSLQDSLEKFFAVTRSGTPYYDLNTHRVEKIILRAENIRHKEIKKMYRKIDKNPTDSYLFEWWFLLNYRPYFIIENSKTGEISYAVFKEDKGYVWLRSDDPEKKYWFWIKEEYLPVYYNWGKKRRTWKGESLPGEYWKNSNNPKKQE